MWYNIVFERTQSRPVVFPILSTPWPFYDVPRTKEVIRSKWIAIQVPTRVFLIKNYRYPATANTFCKVISRYDFLRTGEWFCALLTFLQSSIWIWANNDQIRFVTEGIHNTRKWLEIFPCRENGAFQKKIKYRICIYKKKEKQGNCICNFSQNWVLLQIQGSHRQGKSRKNKIPSRKIREFVIFFDFWQI